MKIFKHLNLSFCLILSLILMTSCTEATNNTAKSNTEAKSTNPVSETTAETSNEKDTENMAQVSSKSKVQNHIYLEEISAILRAIYRVDEKDLAEWNKFLEITSDSKYKDDPEALYESEEYKHYIAYLKEKIRVSDKIKLSDEVFESLMANRSNTFMVTKAAEDGILREVDIVTLDENESMGYLDYTVVVKNKEHDLRETYKGTVRVEDGQIAHMEIGKELK